jgi:hypothetical protein
VPVLRKFSYIHSVIEESNISEAISGMWERSSSCDVPDTVLCQSGERKLFAWCSYLGAPEAAVALHGRIVFVGGVSDALTHFNRLSS